MITIICHIKMNNNNEVTSHLFIKISLMSIPVLYIVANWMLLHKKKLGFYLSLLYSSICVLLGVFLSDKSICILGFIVVAVTIGVLCIKSNGRMGFNVLGIKNKQNDGF